MNMAPAHASPASASSSTLIVTPRLSNFKDGIQFDVLPPSAPGPTAARPHLAITTAPTAQIQAKMSSRGFVEPHHSHMPRRSKPKPKPQAKIAAAGNRDTISNAAASAAADVGVAVGPTSPTSITASSPPPSFPASADPQTPPSKSFPAHLYLPLNDAQTPPTHLLSLHLPPTPMAETATAGLGLGLGIGLGLGPAPPAFKSPDQTPKGNLQPTSANLPRRTSKKLGQTRGRVSSGTRDREDLGSTSTSAAAEGSASASASPTPAAARTRSRSRSPVAVEPTSARLLAVAGKRGRGVSLPRLTPRWGESPLRSSFKQDHDDKDEDKIGYRPHRPTLDRRPGHTSLSAETREKLTEKTIEERTCVQEVGRGSGIEVGFLVGVGNDDLKAEEDFWGLPAEKDCEEKVEEEEEEKLRRQRLRRVILRVVDSYSDSESGSEEEDRESKAPSTSTSVLAANSAAATLIDNTKPSAQHPSSPSSSPDPEAIHDTQPPLPDVQELELDLPSDLKSYKDGQTALTPEQLRAGCVFIGHHLHPGSIDDPSISSSDGHSALGTPSSSSLQIKNQKPTRRRRRRTIRILSPRARPEDAMSLALCYLAYFRDGSTSSTNPTPAYTNMDDAADSDNTWQHGLTPAHLLWMRLLDESDGVGPDTRGCELSADDEDDEAESAESRRVRRHRRGFVEDLHRLGRQPDRKEVDVDVEVVDDDNKDNSRNVKRDSLRRGRDKGVRAEWRGVLSFDGLARVDCAGSSAAADASSR